MNGASSALDSQRVRLRAASPIRPLYWSVRREFWEKRSLYAAPVLAATVFLLGFLISTVHLPDTVRHLAALAPADQHKAIAEPYHMAAGLLMLTAMLVGGFYCVDALQAERRDRSILFWKSLPVSDRCTVLAKAIIPIVLLPLLTFAVTFALQSVMLLVSSAVLTANGLRAATLWEELSFFRMTGLLLYHLVSVHALWQAPFFGWLLLVSAWAPRAAFLWAVLPPVAIGIVEKMAFGTSYLGDVLESRLSGGGMEALTAAGTMPMDPMTHLTPEKFLISPGLWIGLGMTVLFLTAAIRLRHLRGPSNS